MTHFSKLNIKIFILVFSFMTTTFFSNAERNSNESISTYTNIIKEKILALEVVALFTQNGIQYELYAMELQDGNTVVKVGWNGGSTIGGNYGSFYLPGGLMAVNISFPGPNGTVNYNGLVSVPI